MKPFSISHSKLSMFRRCKQAYAWKYVNKYFPPSSMGQQRGTSGHAALAVWHVDYNAQKAMNAAWENWSNAGYQANEEWQVLEDALNRYFQWSKQNDTFKLKVAEQKFEITYKVAAVSAGAESTPYDEIPVKFIGYIDGIVEENNRMWLLENKFLKRMDNSDKSLDPQASLYMLAANLLKYDVSGVIYNKVRIGNSKIAIKEPVVRSRLYRNPKGLDVVQQEMIYQVQEMIRYSHEGGPPYRNPTRDCSWDCSFYQACLSKADDGREPTALLQSITHIRRT